MLTEGMGMGTSYLNWRCVRYIWCLPSGRSRVECRSGRRTAGGPMDCTVLQYASRLQEEINTKMEGRWD